MAAGNYRYVIPGYLTAESDLRGLVAGLRLAERLCDTAALRPYVGAPMAPYPGKVDDATVATLIREHAQTAFHPVGTCRMGSDDAAVVDSELRVRGLDGLRVVDASVSEQPARTRPGRDRLTRKHPRRLVPQSSKPSLRHPTAPGAPQRAALGPFFLRDGSAYGPMSAHRAIRGR